MRFPTCILRPTGVLAGLLLIAAGLLPVAGVAAVPVVEKVDPPSWWAGHSINPVRLLIRGHDLTGARLADPGSGAKLGVEEVMVNSAGTYVFASGRIPPGLRPGPRPLLLQTGGGEVSIPFEIAAPLDPATHFQGVGPDDVIYLIMTDRFANGDRTNDLPAGGAAASLDRANPRAYHGGDFRGIIDRLPYLKELGVTTLWLTPWSQNWDGAESGDVTWTYYHGYHAVDYYGVENRFGGMADLRELVEKAHAAGIKIIQDQVANHVGSRHPWVENPPLADWFHPRRTLPRPFRTNILSSPHTSPAEARALTDGWFTARLPDLNQEEPEVARYEIQNALWWTGITGLDGIRQDTLQFMPRGFIRDLCAALHRQYSRMRMIGEVTARDPAHTAFFLGGRTGWDGIDTNLDSVFDFPLVNASRDVFVGKQPVTALRDILKYDGLYSEAGRLTTVTGNHDMARFAALEGATLEGAMMHMAFTLAVRGTPQIYYGDELALGEGEGADGNRSDFPGGFPGDARSAFEAAGRTPDEQRMFAWTRDWLRVRREHAALRHGTHVDLGCGEDTYLFARMEGEDLVIVAVNRTKQEKELTGSAADFRLPASGELQPLLGQGSGRFANGQLTVKVPPMTVLAFGVKQRSTP